MKSIKSKILALAMSLLLISMIVTSAISVLGTYLSTMIALEESMMGAIHVTADMIDKQLTSYKSIVSQLAVDPVLSQEIPAVGEETADGKTYLEVKREIETYFETLKSELGYSDLQILTEDGTGLTNGQNHSADAFYTVPKNTGEAYMGDPIVHPDTGLLTMTVSAPIMRNGSFGGVMILAIDPQVFSEIAAEVNVGEGSTTTIIDSNGVTIAYNDVSLAMQSYNLTQEAQTDPTLQELAVVEQDLMNGGEGFENVTWDGVAQFAAYTPIQGTNGWGIYVLVHQASYLNQMIISIVFIIFLSALIVIIGAIIVGRVAKNIAEPIKLCADRLNSISQGDLNSPMPEINSNDETGVLANSTKSIVNSIKMMIDDLNYTLSEVAGGNFTVKSKAKEYYVGDFSSLSVSLETIVAKLSSTMLQINDISEQVNSGNEQVAMGAQSLAQGSMEQASAVEELSATIAEIAGQMNQTASDSSNATIANEKSKQALSQSNEQMNEMVLAMENISKKSNEISNIIKTIDDIAFQTNILALNAAVEAARAGSAGKGFAVVADEVRNLATKSAQSAKDTAGLIEQTVAVVKDGNDIASRTSHSISIALENANELSTLVDSIAEASSLQAEGAKQVNIGIEQISAVVQTNSATAEESAATSEELSSQSHTLKQLLSGFTLTEDNTYEYSDQ